MAQLVIADWKAYAAARGQSAVADASDTLLDEALVRGIASTNARYGNEFPGVKTGGRAQSGLWPRSGAKDRDGSVIADDEIPEEYVFACFEMALRELDTPGSTAPDYTANNQIKKVKEGIGPLTEETEYRDAGAEGSQPVFSLVDGIIAPILRPARLTMAALSVGSSDG